MNLSEARRRRLWTIRTLADTAGVSTATILSTEKGRRVPTLATIRKVSDALDMDPLEIDEFRAVIEGDDSAKIAA